MKLNALVKAHAIYIAVINFCVFCVLGLQLLLFIIIIINVSVSAAPPSLFLRRINRLEHPVRLSYT